MCRSCSEIVPEPRKRTVARRTLESNRGLLSHFSLTLIWFLGKVKALSIESVSSLPRLRRVSPRIAGCQPAVVGSLPTTIQRLQGNLWLQAFGVLFGKLPKRTGSLCSPELAPAPPRSATQLQLQPLFTDH